MDSGWVWEKFWILEEFGSDQIWTKADPTLQIGEKTTSYCKDGRGAERVGGSFGSSGRDCELRSWCAR